MALNKRKFSDSMSNNQEGLTNSINSLANGTEIKGDIKSTGDLRIDGKIVGTIDLKGKLVVGKTGIIEGEVSCANCDVQGKISGKLMVREQLSLKSSALIEGDVHTKKLSIEPGAMFNVNCTMNDSKAATGTDKKAK